MKNKKSAQALLKVQMKSRIFFIVCSKSKRVMLFIRESPRIGAKV